MHKDFSWLTDFQLQELLPTAGEKAFEALFDRYWSRLYAYAYRIYGKEKICEDIVQEVFISLWEKPDVQKIINLEAYLLRAVKYRIANHIRDLRFTKVHDSILEEIPTLPRAGQQLEFNDLEQRVHLEISKLPPRCRKVFMLSRFEDLSNSEIAQHLNISIRTVEKHISDALSHLRSNLHTAELSLIIALMFH